MHGETLYNNRCGIVDYPIHAKPGNMGTTSQKRRWFQFTIRQLLWLTFVVALAVSWWLPGTAIRKVHVEVPVEDYSPWIGDKLFHKSSFLVIEDEEKYHTVTSLTSESIVTPVNFQNENLVLLPNTASSRYQTRMGGAWINFGPPTVRDNMIGPVTGLKWKGYDDVYIDFRAGYAVPKRACISVLDERTRKAIEAGFIAVLVVLFGLTFFSLKPRKTRGKPRR